MTCRDVREMLPLHVGGDLAAARARSVSEHVRACEGCSAEAAELAAARRVLAEYDPPDFDDGFYDGIRRSVLDRIAAERPRHWVARLLGWRRGFAVAAAAAVLVSSVTLTAVRREPEVMPLAPAVPAQADEHVPVTPRPQLPNPPAVAQSVSVKSQLARKRVSRKPAAPPAEAPAVQEAPSDPTLASGVDREPEMQKIEMQTSDPNVRIIWFAPKQEGAGLGRS